MDRPIGFAFEQLGESGEIVSKVGRSQEELSCLVEFSADEQAQEFNITECSQTMHPTPAPSCKSVVSIPLETEECPGCGRAVTTDDCYDHSDSIPYFRGQTLFKLQRGPRCPKCHNGHLRFQPEVHHNMVMVRGGRTIERWKGEDYLEKEIFGVALMVVCFDLGLKPDDEFSSFGLEQTPRILERSLNFGKTQSGLSTPIFFDIRTHLAIRRRKFAR